LISGQEIHKRSKIQQYDRDEHADNRTIHKYLGYEIIIVVNFFFLRIFEFVLNHILFYYTNYELQHIIATYQPHCRERHGISHRFHEIHHHQLQIAENIVKIGIRHREVKRVMRNVNRETDVRPFKWPYSSNGKDPF